MEIARLAFATGGVLTLPVATYLAGRWTGQPWLAGLGILASLALLGLNAVAGRIVEMAINKPWWLGGNTMGEFVALVNSIQSLTSAAIVGALILIVARARLSTR